MGLAFGRSGFEAVRSERSHLPVATWVVRRVRLPGVSTYSMVVDRAASDPVSGAYLTGHGVWANAHLIKVMSAVTKPGDRVLDIGSFAGEFALAAAARGCEVIAIEANPSLAPMIATSAAVNEFDQLRVLNAAAGDQAGIVQFFAHGPWGQVVDSTWGAEREYESVTQLTIDDLVAETGWPNVSFAKIDIEGSEMRALAGARNLLGSETAPVLLFESNLAALRNHAAEPPELLRFVESFGYALYRVTSTEIIASTSETFQPEVVSDYLALKGARPEDFGLTARGPLTVNEAADRIAVEARLESIDHRAVMAWALQFAPDALRGHPVVRETLAALLVDSEEVVQRAASWLVEAPDRSAAQATPEVSVSVAEDGRIVARRALEQSASARQTIAQGLPGALARSGWRRLARAAGRR